MKKSIKIIKIIVVFVFIIMFLMPVFMMYHLSKKEMKQYQQNEIYQFKETAYGEPCQVLREDVEQYYLFSGTVTSDSYKFIEFDESESSEIKTLINMGDEVRTGDIIAYIGDREIKSPYNGIVEEIASYSGGYVKLHSLDELKLECMADRELIDKIKDCETLKLEDGNKVYVDFISNVAIDNQVKITFAIENINYMYGQEVQDLKIYTGVVYENALVVNKNCVYQKYTDGPYFVRVLNDQLLFEKELEVEIGFETSELVSIVNVPEGTFCDSGYKALIEPKEE